MDNSVESLLSKLEETIRSGKKQVFSNFRTVDDIACIQLIAKVRESLPESIAQARVVLQERNRIMEKANQQCNNMLFNAKKQADEIVDQSDIVAQAQQKANEIVQEANDYAQKIIKESFNQINELLSGMEYYVGDVLEKVTLSRKELLEFSKKINT